MRGIVILGLVLFGSSLLPAASVAIGQLQVTNVKGYQLITFYNFTGQGNGGCDGAVYRVCNGVTIDSWTLTLRYANSGNSNPTKAPPNSTVTFTSGATDAIPPYGGSGPGYVGSLAKTWEIPLTGVGGTEPACPPCDYQLTKIEFSGKINANNLPLLVGSPGSTSQLGANSNFAAVWTVQSSDSTAPGYVNYGNPQLLGGQYDVFVTDQPLTPVLSISKVHSGNFKQGQTNAAYTVTVSNAPGATPTSGTVTVTENIPAGMTLVSMTGTNWVCASGGNTCTRSDALAAGESYDPIAVAVNVGLNAASSLTNQVSVSALGSSATASDPTTIATAYMVGDIYPFTSDAAPNFGDHNLDILDLVQELFAVTMVPGFVPTACSDRYDAMDAYPVDTGQARGGDGTLDIRDLVRQLFRVTVLDASRPLRTPLGGACGGGSTQSMPTTATSRNTAPRVAVEAVGVLTLGAPEPVSAGVARVAVYLEARQSLSRVALAFALGDLTSALRYVAVGPAPSLKSESQPGVVAAVWTDGLSVQAGQRLLLGYIEGPAGTAGSWKVFGISASELDNDRVLRLSVPDAARY